RALLQRLSAANVDLAVPESPAFAVLGITPQSVTRPTSPRSFATSLLNGLDEKGNFQAGLAIDVAPYLLLAGPALTLEDYQRNRFIRFLGLDHGVGHLAYMRPLKIGGSTLVWLKQGGDLDILSHHDIEARDEKGGRCGNDSPRNATRQRRLSPTLGANPTR